MTDPKAEAEAEAVVEEARAALDALKRAAAANARRIREDTTAQPALDGDAFDPAAFLRGRAGNTLSDAEIAAVVEQAKARAPIATPPDLLPPPLDWRRSLLTAAEVPGEFVAPILAGTIRDEAAIVDVRRWLLTPSRLCVLAGKVGNGKTQAAVWGGIERARRARAELRASGALPHEVDAAAGTMYFCRARDITTYANGDGLTVARRAFAADYLVLDEVGAEVITRDEDRERLVNVIVDRRARPGKWTAITTNLARYREGNGPEQFRERYGARVDDRVGGDWFSFNGPSLRGAA